MELYMTLVSFVLLIASFAGQAVAITQTACSNQNTGSGYGAVSNNYQSNGACSQTCSGYAFAIVQYTSCWCSNIAPGSMVDVGQCSEKCPGYPYELCGNEDSGLFGYIALGRSPQGTAGGASSSTPSSPSSTPSPSSSPSPRPSPRPNTVTALATVTSFAISIQVSSAISIQVSSVLIIPSSSPSQTPSSSPSPSPSPSTTSTPVNTPTPTPSPTPSPSTTQIVVAPPSSTWTPTPSPSIMTIGGTIKTVVITPTAPPQATTTVTVQGPEPAQQSGFFANKGAVAGVFTVVALIVAGLLGFIAWALWRRRQQEQEGSERLNSFEEERGTRSTPFMSRRASELGLRTDMGGMTRGNSDEKTPTSMAMTTPASMSRRASMPLTDQRLNPMAVFHDTGSHVSIASLQDNHDYSRPVLTVANPDRPGSSAIDD